MADRYFGKAYRNATAKRFAPPVTNPTPGIQWGPLVKPGVPANDNPFKGPRPPYFGGPRPPPFVKPGWYVPPWQLSKPAILAGFGAKALPIIGWIVFAKDAYDLVDAIGQVGQPLDPAHWDMMGSGWVIDRACVFYQPNRILSYTTQPAYWTSCLTGQFGADSWPTYPGSGMVGTNVDYIRLMYRYFSGVPQGRVVIAAHRDLPQDSHYSPVWRPEVPAVQPTYISPTTWPPYMPALDPLTTVPFGVPAPIPQPLPYPAIPYQRPNPTRPAPERSDWANADPRPRPVSPRPPFAQPAPVTTVTVPPPGGPPPSVSHGEAPYAPRPPKKNEKEKKFNPTKKWPWFWGGFGAITEASQIVDSIFDALPEFVKKETGGSLWDKVNAIIEWEHVIDWNQAMANILESGASDHWIGKSGKLAGKASGKFGFPVQLGPAL